MFKSNPLPMQGNFVNKQVVETRGYYHRKAEEVQHKNFQHKTRKLDIIEMHKNSLPSLIITFSSNMNKINNITIT